MEKNVMLTLLVGDNLRPVGHPAQHRQAGKGTRRRTRIANGTD